MNLPIEGTTLRLRYVAEMRDGSGVVDSGTDVHLKVHDVTADAWWTGAAWGVETELNGTHFAAGAWYYDLALADGLAGHEIEWVWYDEVDGTVVEDGACEVLGADTLVAAETGAQMDLVDAPNATAVAAVQDGLARETTLAAIKGAGWTDETLVALMSAIDEIEPGSAPTVEEIEAALAAEHGAGRWDRAGALAVAVALNRVIADRALDLELIRGDTETVQFTLRDAASGELIDLSGYTLTLTIKPTTARDDDDDSAAICSVTGTIGGPGTVTFELAPEDFATMARDTPYDYDVQGVDGSTVRTLVRGTARCTFDVTRATGQEEE